MRKCPNLRTWVVLLTAWPACFSGALPMLASDASPNSLVSRAQDNLNRIQLLVDQGSLPKDSLNQARENLADMIDQQTLADLLFGSEKLADITTAESDAMLSAAQRRVERQGKQLAEREKLLALGIIARSEMRSVTDELDSRRRVLELVENRIRLAQEQRQMAAEEQRLAHSLDGGNLQTMVRFNGTNRFEQTDLSWIETRFTEQFHHALPVSAIGQTHLHDSFGLDHRGKVDVALNPDQAEGVWLRRLLESAQLPYIAFRDAVPGAATAPHIHLGLPSTRLAWAKK